MRRALLIVAALAACGGDVPLPRREPGDPERQPGVVVDHKECAGSVALGKLVSLGCREHCLPPVQLPLVCTDTWPLRYLPAGSPPPDYVATRDNTDPGCPDGWRIVTLHSPAQYGDQMFSWGAFPPDGDPCDKKLTPVFGFFGRNLGLFDYYRTEELVPSDY